MKSVSIFFVLAFLAFACGSKSDSENTSGTSPKPQSMVADPAPTDDGKGIGEVKEVALNSPLNPKMVADGKAVYEMKCAACHKLTDQRVVGPGWKNITERRKPEWIMNMTLNVEVMLEQDPVAREMLKECLVRMPNQNLSREDARDVLEFMYANDGKEVGTE